MTKDKTTIANTIDGLAVTFLMIGPLAVALLLWGIGHEVPSELLALAGGAGGVKGLSETASRVKS